MAKLGIFVGIYSVILLVLFVVFCFLITTVNPPPIPGISNMSKYGSDGFMYSNEIFKRHNTRYGLEKVDDDFDEIIDTFPKPRNKETTASTNLRVPYKTNCTRDQFITYSKSFKHIKDLRRSVNNENQQDDAILRSIHLKIKDIDGQPRIEIKIVPERYQTKKSRDNRANVTNEKNYSNDNRDIEKYNNFSQEVVIKVDKNEKIIINFTENYTSDVNESKINPFTADEKNYTGKDVLDASPKLYTLDLLSTGRMVENKSEITNETHQKEVKDATDDYILTKSENNVTKIMTFLFNSISHKKNITDSPNTVHNLTSQQYSTQNDHGVVETLPGNTVPVKSLVGLLIPEATATIPLNYHFIN